MATTTTIRAEVPGHGVYSVRSYELDWAIEHYLPASPFALREMVTYGQPDIDWSDITDVSTLLVVLADMHYPYRYQTMQDALADLAPHALDEYASLCSVCEDGLATGRGRYGHGCTCEV